MGSFSEYCGISQITIKEGNKCVLLPLKQNKIGRIESNYLPSALPIFGEYVDYGRIGNIEEDEHTKMLEERFGCSIEDFCQIFTDESFHCNEDSFVRKKISDDLGEINYMFIDRQVYDFLSSYSAHPHIDFGNKSILEFMDFKYIGEREGERYKQIWEYNGLTFHSDGQWLNGPKGESIYNIQSEHSSCNLSGCVELSDKMIYLKGKSMTQMWEILDDITAFGKLSFIMGIDGFYYFSSKKMHEIIKKHGGNVPDEPINPKLSGEYTDNFRKYGKLMNELCLIYGNMSCMSVTFNPHVSCITPQCGEFENHQKILEKFCEINKSYIYDEDEEE